MRILRNISPLHIILAVTLGFIVSLMLLTPASADHGGFSQTKLIDDSLFVDANSMTVEEIQTFLEEEGGGLLANWVDDVDMHGPDGCLVHRATNLTAAEVIHEAATAWGAERINDCEGNDVEYWRDISGYTLETISPKALLVLLQKEQSLISASGDYSRDSTDYDNTNCCNNNEYKLAWATGFGVPDTGGRNNNFKGFYRQINWAAWQLRFNFERSQGNTDWDEVGFITYSGPMIEGTFQRRENGPFESFDGFYPIDGSPLYMENSATAALYYYTPHTYPGYFGNFNFVHFYEDWFGPVDGTLFVASLVDQSANPTLVQGAKNLMWAEFRNEGSRTWYDATAAATAPDGAAFVELVSANPLLHDSQWSLGWKSSRIARNIFNTVYEADGTTLAANQQAVETGQIVRITYFVGTSNRDIATGEYTDSLQLRTTSGFTMQPVIDFTVNHIQKSFEADLVSFPATETVVAGERELSFVRYQNTGTSNWYDDEATNIPDGEDLTRLITTRSILRSSNFGTFWGDDKNIPQETFGKVFESDGKTLTADQHVVRPGDIVQFNYFLDSPVDALPAGTYTEYFRLQKTDGTIVMPDYRQTITLVDPVESAVVVRQDSPDTVVRGNRTLSWIRFKNTGNTIWYDDVAVNGSDTVAAFAPTKDPIELISTKPLRHSSDWGVEWGPDRNVPNDVFGKVFKANGSLSSNPHRVLPGETVQINFFMSTDSTTLNVGDHFEWVRLAHASGPFIQPAVRVDVTLR